MVAFLFLYAMFLNISSTVTLASLSPQLSPPSLLLLLRHMQSILYLSYSLLLSPKAPSSPSQSTFYFRALHRKTFLLEFSSQRNPFLYFMWESQPCANSVTVWSNDGSQTWLSEPINVVAISIWVETFAVFTQWGQLRTHFSEDAPLLNNAY